MIQTGFTRGCITNYGSLQVALGLNPQSPVSDISAVDIETAKLEKVKAMLKTIRIGINQTAKRKK
ncbi:hypothetical protein AM228_23430 [Planktothricoides sp. SR001]|nr:hypothetical protein AM228_23430 [Planktothricoides sp. SR001]